MPEFRLFCPQCSRQIQCDTGYAGTQINCPACHRAIVVPRLSQPSAAPDAMQTNRGIWTRLIALSSCILAGGSWVLVIVTWGWFLTRPSGSFGEMGGVMLIFYMFPITLGAWLVGGPMALALGGYAAKRVRSGKGIPLDGELAESGILLSRGMLWSGVGLLLLVCFDGLLRAFLE